MSRPQLAEALTAIAIALQGSGGGGAGSNSEALQSFLSGPLKEYWQLLSTKYTRYSILDDVLPQALGEYWAMAKVAFATFDSSGGSARGAEIAVGDFMQLLVTSTLVFKDQQEPVIASFLHAQQTLAPMPRERELQALVFAEFLEAVSKLAIQIIDTNASLGPGKRVRMALNLLCELQNHPARRAGARAENKK